jgi:hypothetical protein
MWEISKFKCFMSLKIQIKFKKTKLWKKKSIKNAITFQILDIRSRV